VSVFAYPYGLPGIDYTSDTADIVAAAGFTHAFTTVPAFAQAGAAAMEIPRFMMLDSIGGAELAHRFVHSWHKAPE
jgi:hypothetical protein